MYVTVTQPIRSYTPLRDIDIGVPIFGTSDCIDCFASIIITLFEWLADVVGTITGIRLNLVKFYMAYLCALQDSMSHNFQLSGSWAWIIYGFQKDWTHGHSRSWNTKQTTVLLGGMLSQTGTCHNSASWYYTYIGLLCRFACLQHLCQCFI